MSRQPRVAVILSGAGFQDGTEIQEAVVAMLTLEEAGAELVYFAPSVPQAQVSNHLTGASVAESRNVLEESARITRGNIRDLKEAVPTDLDAVVLPGGYGAALNLCDFAAKGAAMTVHPDVERLLVAMHKARKPIGAICIAPAILAKLFGAAGARLTIGGDRDTAAALGKLGATHVDCPVNDIVVDEQNRLVTTPAYMLAASVKDIHQGIRRLADAVVRMIRPAHSA